MGGCFFFIRLHHSPFQLAVRDPQPPDLGGRPDGPGIAAAEVAGVRERAAAQAKSGSISRWPTSLSISTSDGLPLNRPAASSTFGST